MVDLFDKEGLSFIFRWLHVLVGIAWIGLLYYFNFVQVPSFATMGAPARMETIEKLATRALWWFRWAAMATAITGLLIIGALGDDYDFDGAPGASILTGMLLGLVMLGNVWSVIWPQQRTVIASAVSVNAGGQALPEAADAGRRALLASRQNAMFSIPLVWFMVATSHWAPIAYDDFEGGKAFVYWILVIAIIAVLELKALGVIGGTAPSQLTWPYESVPNVLISGFVLWLVFLLIWQVLFG